MSDEELARKHILAHGWNSTCFQIVNPGITRWWSRDGQVLVGYVVSGRLAVVAGAPVCAPEHLASGIDEWETFVAAQGLEVCYFGAEERLREVLDHSGGYVQVVLGCQPEWHPTEFLKAVHLTPTLRAQLNRARNKGVRVTEGSLGVDVDRQELEAVLEDWLAHRGLPTLRFLVEPHILEALEDRRLFVARRNSEVVGFVTLSRIPARAGWLTEQFVRATHAPNGTVELLLATAAEAIEQEGSLYITLGIVPLILQGATAPASEPGWLSFSRRWARAHYTRFYNFRGLLEFKAKFRPEGWSPVVVAVKGPSFRLIHLRSIVRAFTGIAPELALLGGILRSAATEFRSLFERSRR